MAAVGTEHNMLEQQEETFGLEMVGHRERRVTGEKRVAGSLLTEDSSY